MKRWLIVAWLVSGMACVAFAGSPAGADLTPAQAQRYHTLTEQLRCLVCQNESIAQSNADLAADLRHLVAQHIVDGDSNDEIKSYLVERYGDWVLYDPPFQWSTWLLWLSPFALLLFGLGIALALLRRRRVVKAEAATTTPSEQIRIQQLLDEHRERNGKSKTR